MNFINFYIRGDGEKIAVYKPRGKPVKEVPVSDFTDLQGLLLRKKELEQELSIASIRDDAQHVVELRRKYLDLEDFDKAKGFKRNPHTEGVVIATEKHGNGRRMVMG